MSEATVDMMADAFRKVLSEGEAGSEEQRAILIKRIPIICNDIIEIKTALQRMSGDFKWVRWLTTGLISGIGLIMVGIVIAFLTAK